ncbi:MAG: heavy metal translocating P-type ATPase [Finegoldia magna]|uniref:heavy metal translocating P-type ATPase n=1 Tax=Finegoldia magna TaxID=1260 RepID=UPI00290C6AC2|nr:heavy metal translocating P-type ATPase [Finegoldia magna]MDU4334772.1 heavy metal translocating P-type ATPase [Finegoldia magna]
MNKEIKLTIVSAIFFAIGFFIKQPYARLAAFAVSYLIVGIPVIKLAFLNLKNGQLFDEHFLMMIATVGAFFVGEYAEGVAVMLFYQIGEIFQDKAVGKSRDSIKELMDIAPTFANLKTEDGYDKVDPYDVNVGDIIVVKPGEKVPLDCVVVDGSSMVDTKALTGESVPITVAKGEELLSGYIVMDKVLNAKVTKDFENSAVTKILDLVENASSQKSKQEKFITKFARVYTPVVVLVAAALAILMPLILKQPFQTWLYRSLTFLVISCPCALVISIPLSFFSGIGASSKAGILVKGSNYIEKLAETDTVVMDKTGTLTQGVFKVVEAKSFDISDEEMLQYVASAEKSSNHPIALSIIDYYGNKEYLNLDSAENIAGQGIKAVINGKQILAGNAKLLKDVEFEPINTTDTVVYVAIDGKFKGYIRIADEIKQDSAQAITDMKNVGIEKTYMLTGDGESVAKSVAENLKIDEYRSKLLPQDKVEIVKELIEKGRKVAFVGDGINDAPVLALSDVGISMGQIGSDAAIEASDVVIMTDEPTKIAQAIKISKKTLKIAKQNAYFAIGVKIIVLILSALGLTNMWAAIFADVGVTVLAILNSFRAMRVS